MKKVGRLCWCEDPCETFIDGLLDIIYDGLLA
jgi:hypothetical protein